MTEVNEGLRPTMGPEVKLGPGQRRFSDLKVGDEFALGNLNHHSAWFKVTYVPPREQFVDVEYRGMHDELKKYRWRYGNKDACLVKGA